ncbi:MAG: ferrous iron transport protein B [Tissierellia bacterium]|nr:ferrous iron transport protein B [Tissierellia bacterium]
MGVRIALAGNPNSGKTTLFNGLTGSNQYVGNWPGVTVEKKSGYYRKNKEIEIIDLPGVYSLSPYTLEEVVTRDYLINETPDVIIDIIDATNIERNLYLATQLSEIGIPMVLAFNMMDLVEKNKDQVDIKAMEKHLGCPIVEISALHRKNIDKVIDVAVKEAKKDSIKPIDAFSPEVEHKLIEIEDHIEGLKDNPKARWFAIKVLENDDKALENMNITAKERSKVRELVHALEEELDDDGESIVVGDRYQYIARIVQDSVKKGREGLTTTDKIDRIVTNRWLAMPIFALVMFVIYYIAISIVGGDITDFWADELWGETIPDAVSGFLGNIGVADWLSSLIGEGIIGGVGAVIGFLPIIATLQLFIAILEDIGYMSRIAFILDRAFRRFGLSGKSFIPILIGTGCSVPGITATRTIENDNDRRMTIIIASFMPCGAKVEIIALFTAVILNKWWIAPLCYFIGIGAVIISGLILKKTSMFAGEPAPFVMELPSYHRPMVSNILRVTWDRIKQFLRKAGTIILLSVIAVWILQHLGIENGSLAYIDEDSAGTAFLTYIGNAIAPLFAPLGFGNGPSAVATFLGLVAKEVVVGTFGVMASLGETAAESDISQYLINGLGFTTVTAMSFMVFNQLTVPCFAAVGAIKEEMQDRKWTLFAIGYQIVFSYAFAFMIYQFGRILVLKEAFNVSTGIAIAILLGMIYLMVRKDRYKGTVQSKRSVES